MGPFDCPEDHKVYIDLAFYEDLKTRFKAPGDLAQAYVIAQGITCRTCWGSPGRSRGPCSA